MAVKTEAVGKRYPPFEYEVGKEKIAEYARAIGAENPVHFDRQAARDAGFRDVVAPPMFAVVYSSGSRGAGHLRPRRRHQLRDAWCTAARSSCGASRWCPAT